MEATENSPFIKFCKLISNFFNPLISLVIYYIYSSFSGGSATSNIQFLPILFIIILPILFWLIYNVKVGKYSNMDVSNREQRKSLYLFIAGVMLLYLAYDYFIVEHLNLEIVFIFLLLIAMQISNYFIKSSMHTAFNVLVAAFLFVLNPLMGAVWMGISILVGYTRILLKRHSLKEVLMGAFLALVISLVYIFMYISMNFNH